MNKGLQIRNNKLKKNTKKRNTVKPEQENVCRFITIRYEVIERINGKYKHTGNATAKGLQVKNRVYLTTGSYKLINSKSVKITQIFNEVPTWATDELIKMYQSKQ